MLAVETGRPTFKAPIAAVDVDGLRRDLERAITGEVRFDSVSRALYSTDASVYQIRPIGVVIPRTQDDIVRIVELCDRYRCPLTMRGGGTSQAGQAIGEGLNVDTSKYCNRLIEVNVAERWAIVEPGIVLDELNAQLKQHGLRFAPDISTASRATLGGMMANNSSGARSVLYGKTIDHVLEQWVVLADGTQAHFRPVSREEADRIGRGASIEAAAYREVLRLSREHADEIDRRYPKILRRVGGYNLDAFVEAARDERASAVADGVVADGVEATSATVDMTRMMVGSEGTLGVVLKAKVRLVPLPKAKAVLAIQFKELLEALEATPAILAHSPSAVEVMDGFILENTRQSAALDRMRRTFIDGDPGALLCVEFYDDTDAALPPRLQALEADLRARGYGYRYFHALDLAAQQRIWSLREAALGLSMAMREEAKSISFVEDTAVAPERLRDYIDRFLALIKKHGTSAGIYAHASVGCLHVRPVVNLKTDAGVKLFEALATDVSDLVLEFGGALSGEHGDGLVRSPFMRKMFGPVLYEAFRDIKRTFDPHGIFNPGKIVDAPPMTENLRYGAGYVTPNPSTYFDYSEYGGLGGAIDMCSGLGACRKKIDGTMCPSYQATREENDVTRGRANVLRLALAGTLNAASLSGSQVRGLALRSPKGEGGFAGSQDVRAGSNGRVDDALLSDEDVKATLDLCLECRACKAECPVGVDVARYKSEFLARYWARYGTSMKARALGHVAELAALASPVAPLANAIARSTPVRWLNEKLLGIDSRRLPPKWVSRSFEKQFRSRRANANSAKAGLPALPAPPALPGLFVFRDTFTNYYTPSIGMAGVDLLERCGHTVDLAPNVCCGRPLISQGLLDEARQRATENTERLYPLAERGARFIFFEPSCLSALKEDVPDLLRGAAQQRARRVAEACVLFESYVEHAWQAGELALPLQAGPTKVLLHGHCHQKSLGQVAPAKALLSRIPGATVVDLDAGCCGMAGSFGYTKDHYDVSKAIGERRLLPSARAMESTAVLVASGMSCRHQVDDFADVRAMHPAELLQRLLVTE